MTKISLFTDISYSRPTLPKEKALSTLSHYFYLGGARATVIKGNEVQLENGKVASYKIALKVASYVLLFPLTLTLFAIHFTLHNQHKFTLISFPKRESKTRVPLVNVNLFSPESQALFQGSAPAVPEQNSAPIFIPVRQEATLSDAPPENESVIIDMPKEHDSVIIEIEEEIDPSKKTAPTFLEMLQQTATNWNPLTYLWPTPKNPELDEFKKKLKCFFTFEKNLEQIGKELFQIAPENLKIEQIIHLIFSECNVGHIPLFLSAIESVYPSFTLSPYNQIRKAIATDENHLLRNQALERMLKEQGLLNEEKLTDCYDLAYRANHPYLYRLSEKPVLPNECNHNFLWANLNPQDRINDIAQNIFNDGLELAENSRCILDKEALRQFENNEQSLELKDLENWNQIKKSFTYRISRWADANPGAQMNLWYDSALVTEKAQLNTFEMMAGISKSRGVDLQLRDIRNLPNIEGEIENSLHPGTNLFYRIDVLKAAIADHMISSPEASKYFVFSDIDVEPMTREELFDQRTLDYLSSNGYVFNRLGLLSDIENSFFIFNKEKKDLQKIHNETIIKQTATAITALRMYPKGSALISPPDAQFVFKQYALFREKMKESASELAVPRKVVKCPKSQFNYGGHFSQFAHQIETFRFIGDSHIPYTRNGRNFPNEGEEQIDALINWKAVPLPSISNS